jgi:anaerobic selenocysteine-containing dehydrogenase
VARGKYCIKALGFVDGMYNPDRLLVTLKRPIARERKSTQVGSSQIEDA